MPTILGSGEHRYRVVENWAKLPAGWNLTDVASVAVDSKDRIYVFNRGDHPMVVLDRATYAKVLLTSGIPNKPAPFMSGDPFHRCTHTALSPKGEIYVSDGYG